jgi:hypothetical protein
MHSPHSQCGADFGRIPKRQPPRRIEYVPSPEIGVGISRHDSCYDWLALLEAPQRKTDQ